MKLATRIFKRDDWYVTSAFGYRTSPITKRVEFHNGTDYGTKVSKWPQHGLESGFVLAAGKDSTGALFAWIRYPRLGKDILHYHLDKLLVKTGAKVNADTVIGTTGRTGKATGIHLHLALRNIGSTVRLDPHAYEYKEAVEDTFKVGDKVVPTRLVNYTGVRLRQWDKVYFISSIRKDRAVLKANRNGRLITWAAMNVKDLKKV